MARAQVSSSHSKIERRTLQMVRAELMPPPQGSQAGYVPLTTERIDEDGATYTEYFMIWDEDEWDEPAAVWY